jgi:transglutaminase-like putative cysteine protease
MKLSIEHTTTYRYDAPVSLGPHNFRLRPRCDPAQRLLDFNLEADPAPVRTWSGVDHESNAFETAIFAGLTDTFTIRSAAKIQGLVENPFDYLFDPLALSLPIRHGARMEARLQPYLRTSVMKNGSVASFAHKIGLEASWHTGLFLTQLNRRIWETCGHEVREHGDPRPAEETLHRRSGACRDFAVLMIEACRCVGIAARFVSGYQVGGFRPDEHTLHAWVEVYLPGAGWRGYDPSCGLAVGSGHVAVSSGADFADAAPIEGTYHSTPGCGASISTTIEVRRLDAASAREMLF